MLSYKIYYIQRKRAGKYKNGKPKFKNSFSKLDLRKKNIKAYVSVSDGINKVKREIHLDQFRKKRKKGHRIDKLLMVKRFQELGRELYNKRVKEHSETMKKVYKHNYIVAGEKYKKSHEKLVSKYKSQFKGKSKFDIRYSRDIADIIDVEISENYTSKSYDLFEYNIETSYRNHPSFLLQESNFNDLDNPRKYKKIIITWSIRFTGMNGKELSNSPNYHSTTFDYYDELLKIKRKWLIPHYTPTHILLDKVREYLSNKNVSMSGKLHQVTPENQSPDEPLSNFILSIKVKAFRDKTGKFDAKFTEQVHKVMENDAYLRMKDFIYREYRLSLDNPQAQEVFVYVEAVRKHNKKWSTQKSRKVINDFIMKKYFKKGFKK
jgi:hypothetical protein